MKNARFYDRIERCLNRFLFWSLLLSVALFVLAWLAAPRRIAVLLYLGTMVTCSCGCVGTLFYTVVSHLGRRARKREAEIILNRIRGFRNGTGHKP